jgi:hypothetical protein
MAFMASIGLPVASAWLLILATPHIPRIATQRQTITVMLLPQAPDPLQAPSRAA